MRKNLGFTLMETVIALAIGTIVATLAATLITLLSNRFNELTGRLDAQVTAAHAEVVLRSYFSQAVNIVDTGLTTNTIPSPAGEIRDNITYTTISAAPADWTTLAIFWRENSTGQATTNFSALRQTVMWFRRPTLTTSGVLVISSRLADGTGNPVAPVLGDDVIDRVSELTITKNITRNVVASVDINLAIRYFYSQAGGFNWCPALDVQSGAHGCGAVKSNFKDLKRSFRITVMDNLVKADGVADPNSPTKSEERVSGGIYFFKLINPARWQ